MSNGIRKLTLASGVALALAAPYAAAATDTVTGSMYAPHAAADSSLWVAQRGPDGTPRDEMHRDGMGSSPMDRGPTAAPETSGTINAEAYIGKDVVNPQGEEVGKVDDIVLSRMDQRPYAVIGVGGVLGIGQRKVTVPLETLDARGDKVLLVAPLSKDQLKQQPEYEPADFSAFEPERSSIP